jgi:predicted N-formylglutamate amidohydrolase
MDTHAEGNGYPHVLLEVRQDLIGDEAGALEWAGILHGELREILKDPGLNEVVRH